MRERLDRKQLADICQIRVGRLEKYSLGWTFFTIRSTSILNIFVGGVNVFLRRGSYNACIQQRELTHKAFAILVTVRPLRALVEQLMLNIEMTYSVPTVASSP